MRDRPPASRTQTLAGAHAIRLATVELDVTDEADRALVSMTSPLRESSGRLRIPSLCSPSMSLSQERAHRGRRVRSQQYRRATEVLASSGAGAHPAASCTIGPCRTPGGLDRDKAWSRSVRSLVATSSSRLASLSSMGATSTATSFMPWVDRPRGGLWLEANLDRTTGCESGHCGVFCGFGTTLRPLQSWAP